MIFPVTGTASVGNYLGEQIGKNRRRYCRHGTLAVTTVTGCTATERLTLLGTSTEAADGVIV